MRVIYLSDYQDHLSMEKEMQRFCLYMSNKYGKNWRKTVTEQKQIDEAETFWMK